MYSANILGRGGLHQVLLCQILDELLNHLIIIRDGQMRYFPMQYTKGPRVFRNGVVALLMMHTRRNTTNKCAQQRLTCIMQLS